MNRLNRHRKLWTRRELILLEAYWGTFQLELICERLQRSELAIARKAHDLGLTIRQGCFSFADLLRETGYGEMSIRHAASRAGVSLRKAPRATAEGRQRIGYRITDEQRRAIVEELRGANSVCVLPTRTGEWGTGEKPECCIDCGRSSLPHKGRGRCAPCLQRDYRKRRKLREAS
jgi:hypothetical protein